MVRPELPDPLFVHQDWLSLNGEWEFEETPNGKGQMERWNKPTPWRRRIVAPFCVEAKASGLGRRPVGSHLWYRRRLEIPADWRGKRIYLRVGAADQYCEGYVNGRPVGMHDGGFGRMTWRIDPLLRDGENILTLYVRETIRPSAPRGKQTNLPFAYAVFYQPFSGVWQPIWIEARGWTNVARAHAVPTPEGDAFDIRLRIKGPAEGELEIKLTHPDGGPDAELRVPITSHEMIVRLPVRRAAWWSPDAPALYGVEYVVWKDGAVVDRSTGYAGLRTLRIAEGKTLLNGAPFYQKLLLYQAYYPEGWVTPVDDEVFRRDVELIKAMGFNGVRVHQTLADPRFLYWCDKLGLLVWDEMPSPFVFAKVDRAAFEAMLREAIQRDRGHPCVVTWVLFNETWGILDIDKSDDARAWVRSMVKLTRELDPTRWVIDNSGYEHLDTDILDFHHYLKDPERIRELYRGLAHPASMSDDKWRRLYMALPGRVHNRPLAPTGEYHGQPVVISECGGHGFGPYSKRSQSLADSLRQTFALLADYPHIQGFAYTQFCDVAQEKNGLVTFDRQPKVTPEDVRKLLAGLGGRAGA